MKLISLFAAALLSVSSHAQDIPLQNLSNDDVKNLIKETSANFNHTSVSGASSLGTIWGFEVGLVGGITKTPKIDELVKRAEPQTKADQIPHGQLLGRLTVPAGVTVEAGFIPKFGKEDFKFNTLSLGVMWTPTDVLLDWPLSVAGKFHITRTNLDFRDEVGSPKVDTTFKYQSTTTVFSLLVSKNFVLVEPYAAILFGQTKGDLDVTGSNSVFNVTGQTSASGKSSGTGFAVGTELKLLIFKAGLEYSKLFDTGRFTGKLAFYF